MPAIGLNVSISLSSGFSFQVRVAKNRRFLQGWFQSRYRAASHFRDCSKNISRAGFYRFNLVIERLLISGSCTCLTSSQSKKFQSRYRAASHFRVDWDIDSPADDVSFNLVIERLLISGFGGSVHRCLTILSFNLVIERLLISGNRAADFMRKHKWSFNLVIERLLISGARLRRISSILQVSISLSSGFSFQVRIEQAVRRLNPRIVSISLSSGFSFQVELHGYISAFLNKFQSRYRAASHFRLHSCRRCVVRYSEQVSISLSSGFSFQDKVVAFKAIYMSELFQSRYRAASHFRKCVPQMQF